jgi:hypothetical protein
MNLLKISPVEFGVTVLLVIAVAAIAILIWPDSGKFIKFAAFSFLLVLGVIAANSALK